MTQLKLSRDAQGAPWEKRGNTAWVACARCQTWFPIATSMLRATAPDCHCPNCHHEFSVRREP